MKCPECSTKQKSTGKTCSKCGYSFALHPQDPPRLSDLHMKKAIENLSANGQYYFTFNQLYAAVYRIALKKQVNKKGIVAVAVVALFGCIVLAVNGGKWPAMILAAVAGMGIILYLKRRRVPDHDAILKAITTYRGLHPIEKLVDGNRFKRTASGSPMDRELFDYAPERILIVQSNDLVDMLVLNRFHLDNKALVVSASKYPETAFSACQEFLKKRPDIPVEILHDASMEGCKLMDKLLADVSWNLKDKAVKDLGLSVQDAANIKKPIWIPTRPLGRSGAGRSKDPVEDKLQSGMKMPVDFVGPGVLLGGLSIAALAGLALMSTELLAEQARRKDLGGGYG